MAGLRLIFDGTRACGGRRDGAVGGGDATQAAAMWFGRANAPCRVRLRRIPSWSAVCSPQATATGL